MRKRVALAVVLALLAIGAGVFYVYGRGMWFPLYLRIAGERTITDALARYGPAARTEAA